MLAKILSLFGGMNCAHIAFDNAGVDVEVLYSYEIDKYANAVSKHNFPNDIYHGDVFKADFTQYEGVDFVVGGSPCTYWSIAQKNNRETEASGMGWELFQQYTRAIREAKPKHFVYENNKSMSKAIRASIDEAFGFEAIGINSALVSAQNRQRLYWVGKRNSDGTYSKVEVEQPEDRGILLRDILESGVAFRNEKAYCLDANYYKGGNVSGFDRQSGQRLQVAEPVRIPEYGIEGKARPIESTYANHSGTGEGSLKAVTQSAQGGGLGAKTGLYAVPFHGMNGDTKSRTLTANYWKTSVRDAVVDCAGGRTVVVEKQTAKATKVYQVKDGQITIKGKQYPIKLADGFYIIRKLSVRECMRLQTVPEWYDFSVISNSQAYKCLGNGWTCEVITHLINACLTGKTADTDNAEQLCLPV